MKWKLQLKIMYAALRKNAWRSILVIICVGMGIASFMVTLTLSIGAERELAAISDKVGKNIFVINAGMIQSRFGQGWLSSTKLNLDDAKMLAEQIPDVKKLVPVREGSRKTRFNRSDLVTTVKGVSPQYFTVRNYTVDDGRLFDDFDGESKSRVAVVGTFIAQKINEGQSLVGEKIWIGDISFEVIGQLKEKGISTDGINQDDVILIPIETSMYRVFNSDYLSSILVQVYREQEITGAQYSARELLRVSHSLDVDVKDDFEILSLVKVNQVKRLSSQFLQGISQLFSFITLAIGGAGVFAMTLMSVKDRTSEIGLRMAVGAKRSNIVSQFIAEACVLSVIGGLCGVLIGSSMVVVLMQVTEWSMVINPRSVAIPIGVSVVMGVIFGVLPAITASRLRPVEALRLV